MRIAECRGDLKMAQVYLAVQEEGANWVLVPFDTAEEALQAVKLSATYGAWKILKELEIKIGEEVLE